MKIWEPKTPGTLWATPGLARESFTFTFLLTRALRTRPISTCHRSSSSSFAHTGCWYGLNGRAASSEILIFYLKVLVQFISKISN